MKKPTQKELCVRYLVSRGIGNWVPGYDIVKYASGKENIIQDADTRMYEIIRDGGHYDSPNNRYTVETKKEGKFAYFRVLKKEPMKHERVFIRGMGSLKDFTFA